MGKERKIILFTGQSGIKLNGCLSKLKKYIAIRSNLKEDQIEIMNFEACMLRLYLNDFPEEKERFKDHRDFMLFLLQPKKVLKKYWEFATFIRIREIWLNFV